jgi:hypothetical protein
MPAELAIRRRSALAAALVAIPPCRSVMEEKKHQEGVSNGALLYRAGGCGVATWHLHLCNPLADIVISRVAVAKPKVCSCRGVALH